jgi:mRNA-degrading endonuclease RelE of RelBE toxin-antitoxin system
MLEIEIKKKLEKIKKKLSKPIQVNLLNWWHESWDRINSKKEKKNEASLLTNIMLNIGIEKKTNCMRLINNKNK